MGDAWKVLQACLFGVLRAQVAADPGKPLQLRALGSGHSPGIGQAIPTGQNGPCWPQGGGNSQRWGWRTCWHQLHIQRSKSARFLAPARGHMPPGSHLFIYPSIPETSSGSPSALPTSPPFALTSCLRGASSTRRLWTVPCIRQFSLALCLTFHICSWTPGGVTGLTPWGRSLQELVHKALSLASLQSCQKPHCYKELTVPRLYICIN